MLKYLFVNPNDEESIQYGKSVKDRLELMHSDLSIIQVNSLEGALEKFKQDTHFELIAIYMDGTSISVEMVLNALHTFATSVITVVCALELTYSDRLSLYYAGTDLCIITPTIRDNQLAYAFFDAQYRRIKHLTSNWIKLLERFQLIDKLHYNGGVVVEANKRQVSIKGQMIHLTPKEYDLLIYLISNCNTVVTKEQIAYHVWQMDDISDSELTSYIARLRAKIEPEPHKPTYILTKHSVGYMFVSK